MSDDILIINYNTSIPHQVKRRQYLCLSLNQKKKTKAKVKQELLLPLKQEVRAPWTPQQGKLVLQTWVQAQMFCSMFNTNYVIPMFCYVMNYRLYNTFRLR